MAMRIFTFAFIFILSIGTIAQNEYFQNNPVWQCSSSCMWNFPCLTNETYNYYINGDTIINSLTYKKIFKKGNGSYFWSSPNPNQGCYGNYTFIYTAPSFFLRSAGKKIFLRPGSSADTLLYDFNLSVNSTLPLTYNNSDPGITVTSIDSFLTPNGYYKRFALSGNTWCTYLIEGIGHDKGLVEPMQVPLECGYNLLCYGQNNSGYYPASGPTCELNVGEDELPNFHSVRIAPNPFTSRLNISSGINDGEISIFDLTGQVLFRLPMQGRSEVSLDLAHLSPGIYFLKITDGASESVSKIVKQY